MSDRVHELVDSIEGASQILRAAGIPADLQGARRVLATIESCVQAAERAWPNTPLRDWVQTLALVPAAFDHAHLEHPKQALRLLEAPPAEATLAHAILNFPVTVSRQGPEHALAATLGRALVAAAEANGSIHVEFVKGLRTLKRALQGSGRRSPAWDAFARVDILNHDEVLRFHDSLGPKSPVRPVVGPVAAVLAAGINGPEPRQKAADHKPNETAAAVGISISDVTTPLVEGNLGHSVAISSIPDVAARLKAADRSSFPAKLGLPDRDKLLPEDLRYVTEGLMTDQRDGDPRSTAYSTLGLTSLVTGCTDFVAVNLKFEPSDSIWLDIERGAWCWDFRRYRGYQSEALTETEPIVCPLPKELAQRLQDWRNRWSNARSLGELLAASQGQEQVDLKDFREYLRTKGDPVHTAYRARFSRSFAPAMLSITKSDMATAMLCAQFEATAPAALFYYGPRYSTLLEAIASTYTYLGLGEATNPSPANSRIGCKKVLEADQSRTGWSALMESANNARTNALNSDQAGEKLRWCNAWLQHLCAAFVIQTGHRASRIDCLTFAALFTDEDLGVIHDKDDTQGYRPQPRLIPWTTQVKRILASCLECHAEMSRATHGSDIPFGAPRAPVFVRWIDKDQHTTSSALATRDVHEMTTRFFASEANFGRAMWVTYLDEMHADRWLIRSLTGHARDITRTNGAYFDLPPVKIAELLRYEMEAAGREMFGEAMVASARKVAPYSKLIPRGSAAPSSAVASKPANPTDLLEPITQDVLVGWKVGTQIRARLIAGGIDVPRTHLGVLHFLFTDLVPDADAALEAALAPKAHCVQIGRRAVLAWNRPHFAHPALVPLQPTTWRLIADADEGPISREDLYSSICAELRRCTPNVRWPTNAETCWAAVQACAAALRRFELPPSLVAMAIPDAHSPSLSIHSVERLAGMQTRLTKPLGTIPFLKPVNSAKKGSDLRWLVTTMHKYSDTRLRHGERRRRSTECRAAINEAQIAWTPFGSLLKDWIIEELERTRDAVSGSYQITSLSTYLSTLVLAHAEAASLGPPEDWEAEEWHHYIERTNAHAEPRRGYALGGHQDPRAVNNSGLGADSQRRSETLDLNERARPAVLSLIRSLQRRQIFVPAELSYKFKLEDVRAVPGNSASSTLILQEDLEAARTIARAHLSESPADALKIDLRAALSDFKPLRSGDLSSLARNCVTRGGGLVIERLGYNVHKTDSTVRVVELSRAQLEKLANLKAELAKYTGETPFLLRGNGNPEDGTRDWKLTQLWTESLKIATQDHRARPHSTRAAAVQQIAWPEWQAHARTFLQGESSPINCRAWVSTLEQDWHRVSSSAAAAGHVSLTSVLGHYCAGWTVVYAMYASALLAELQPAPAFLRQLEIGTAGARKARSRQQASDDQSSAADSFDAWRWIANHRYAPPDAPRGTRQLPPTPLPPVPIDKVVQSVAPAQNAAPMAPAKARLQQVTATHETKLRYLVTRTLGLSLERSIEATSIPSSIALSLDRYVPDADTIHDLTRRARCAAGPRGQRANVALALSSRGQEITRWIADTPAEAFQFLRHSVMRSAHMPDRYFQKHELWKPVVARMPAALMLVLRRGSSHISDEELTYYASAGNKLKFSPDPRLGARPSVSLYPASIDNRVEASRLTSVLKATLLAHQVLIAKDPTDAH